MSQTYFATINPGLEDALVADLRELGARKAKKLVGGVEFQATNKVLYGIVLRVRCANRVLLRVDEFRARDFPELFKKTARIDWTRLVGDHPVEVRATAQTSRLIHSGRIDETVAKGVDINRTVKTSGKPIMVQARLENDRCQLSLDASGELLYMRGWRKDSALAPLRETVAASLIRLSGWKPGETVVDPTCGSGTFVIEAAQRAAGITAGRDREFSIENWANLQRETWDSARAAETPSEPQGSFLGFDSSPDMVSASMANAERAHVASFTRFETRAVQELTCPDTAPGWVFSNPPYGLRLPDEKQVLKDLLDRFATQFTPGWTLGVVFPSDTAISHPALESEAVTRFSNGGIPVTWWHIRHAA